MRRRVLPDPGREGGSVRILVSGSSGLIGSALVPALSAEGHAVSRLVRGRPGPGDVLWGPARGAVDAARLEGFDAAVHLAGESVAGRWTRTKKAAVRDSRVRGTRLLAEAFSRLSRPPQVLICASAVGFYGDRGDEVLTEQSAPGSDFLAGVCREWEAAAAPAAERGMRVAHLRFGVVLSPRGGALARMLPPFRLGLGGVIGSGRQYMSWISLDDAVGAVRHVLLNGSLAGPVNVTAPQPVTNRQFTRALGRALGRPTIFPMPAFAARLAFGEMADALLLSGARAEPARLLSSGYAFRTPDLEGALRRFWAKRPDSSVP